MPEPLIIHITAKRYEKIRSQGWEMPNAYYVVTSREDPVEGDTVYHIGHDCVDDCWFCEECRTMVQSTCANTPAELNAMKENMRRATT